MISTRSSLIVALMLGAASADAAQTLSLQGWYQYSNSDFTIVSQMGQSDTVDWASRLNQFIHAMRGRLPGDEKGLGPYTLVLFNSKGDLWDAAPLRDNGSPSLYLGAFSRSGGWGAIAATSERGSSENTQRMIFGTCVDWLLSADHRHRPRALEQGFNEVYGAYVIDYGKEIFGRPIRGRTTILQRAVNHPLENGERFLKVEDLLSVNDMNVVADRHGEPMFNLESWAFAHFLLFSKDMAPERGMDRLLDAFGRRLSPHDALESAFGEGAKTINSRFQNYILGGDFYEVAAPIEDAPLGTPPAPADQALVASTLARLEVSARRLDAARSYAEQAVRLGPNDPGPREALAQVDYFSHHDADAEADCREAIRLGSRDGWTWYEASAETGVSDAAAPGAPIQLTSDQARDAMNASEKAILLCRGLQVAYARVAALVPAASRVTEDDGKFLAFGRQQFPGDGRIVIGHAQWAHRVHDDALALKIIADVLARPAEFRPEDVDQARALQNQWAAGSG